MGRITFLLYIAAVYRKLTGDESMSRDFPDTCTFHAAHIMLYHLNHDNAVYNIFFACSNIFPCCIRSY